MEWEVEAFSKRNISLKTIVLPPILIRQPLDIKKAFLCRQHSRLLYLYQKNTAVVFLMGKKKKKSIFSHSKSKPTVLSHGKAHYAL